MYQFKCLKMNLCKKKYYIILYVTNAKHKIYIDYNMLFFISDPFSARKPIGSMHDFDHGLKRKSYMKNYIVMFFLS